MPVIILFLFFLCSGSTALAQNLLNNPESVVFDSLRNRYLVSNVRAMARLFQIDENNQQTVFSDVLSRVCGLLIQGDTLYAASSMNPFKGLMGFNLETGEHIIEVHIDSSEFLNDLDADAQGNIYLSDFYDRAVYKIYPPQFVCRFIVRLL